MKTSDIQIGLRVRVINSDRNALVVSNPEYYTARTKLVRIKYENSTRYEYTTNHLIEALSLQEQYPALGGSYVTPEGNF
jgi:tRNA1(Val) A37 N6-methylase TrmN6